MATIRKRGDSYQIDYFDPTGKRIRKSFKKKKVAGAELGKRVSLIAEGRYLDIKKDHKTILEELLKKYKKNYQHQPSFDRTKRFWLENFKEYFGKKTLLSNIRYVDLETYRNHLRQKLTKNGTIRTNAAINREMSCLRHVFSKAVDWEVLTENPFNKKARGLFTHEDNERLRYLDQHEIEILLAECSNHLRGIVICAINTGMDRAEILNLKWDQIRNGFIYLRTYKTRPTRQVPVNDDLRHLFKEIRQKQQLKSEYVFTFWNGEHNLKGDKPVRKRKGPAPVPQTISSVKTAFKSACRRAGIEDFRFKDLRHTFASHMVMRGASMKELQELMGHKTMNMTMRYAHLSQEHKKKAVNLLNGLTAPSKKAICHKSVTSLKPADSPTS